MWLARAFDKARAKAAETHDGYIYPCPVDRAMMRRWGLAPREFTAAVSECQTDDDIVAWFSRRIAPDRARAANAWLVRQTFTLDRQDADEGVPGAIAPRLPWQTLLFYVAIALLAGLFLRIVLRALHV